jgi:hypothetical protein
VYAYINGGSLSILSLEHFPHMPAKPIPHLSSCPPRHTMVEQVAICCALLDTTGQELRKLHGEYMGLAAKNLAISVACEQLEAEVASLQVGWLCVWWCVGGWGSEQVT